MAGSMYTTLYGSGTSNSSAMGNQTYADGTVVTTNTTTGTKIAGAANQKLGLWGVTPVVQPAGTSELIGMNGNGATAANAVNINSNGNSGSALYNFNDVVKALKAMGGLTA